VLLVIGAKRIFGVLKLSCQSGKKEEKERKKVLSRSLVWTNGGSSGIKNNVRIELGVKPIN